MERDYAFEMAASNIRFGEATKPWKEDDKPPRWFNGRKTRCVWQESLKYIRTPYAGTEEFYDLAADASERSNLLGPAMPASL